MSKVNRIVRTFVAASLCVALCDSVLAGDVPWSNAGPHKIVTIASLQLTDAVRGRTIEVLVRHPEGPGPYPVIIFSHGSFSNKDTFSPAPADSRLSEIRIRQSGVHWPSQSA